MHKGEARRVIAIGLDGATLDLLQQWISDGSLPNLRRMRDSGAWGTLTTEMPPATVPGWPSFMTGTNPGKHGVIFWIEKAENENTFRVKNGSSIKVPTLWDILGDHGKRSIVINVPCTYPPRPINGLLVAGMLTPPARNWTYPPGLAAEIENEIGQYIIFPREVYCRGREEQFIAELHLAEQCHYSAAKYLMRKHDWDFFMVHFQSSDLIQHAFWHFVDHTHPRYDPDAAKRYGNETLRLYQRLDRFIGDLWETAGQGTYCFVLSDHGAGPLYKRTQLNNWLLENGFLRLRGNIASRLKYWAFRHGLTMENAYRVVLRLGLANLRKAVDSRRKGGGLLRRVFLSFSDVDWKRTKAYIMGGQVYLTLSAASQPEQYEDLRNQIIRGLRTIRSAETDDNLVTEIFRKEEIFSGPELERLPDILFLTHEMGVEEAGDFEFFSHRLFHDPLGISGSHRKDGIVFISGPESRQAHRLADAKLIDVAPTILYLLGVPVPEWMDGRALLESFSNEFVVSHPVLNKEECASARARPRERMPDGEDEEIKSRLRGLGYI